ncbi:MAG: bifunctional diaminohydroxyphosphoribosylaminopyrimidine deaminase/5-amino-6-(5-phosphoribosylamino)uracil reductase RibD [Brevinematales bacterium]|jgi:diaminohydroxyphosphoribosylaminopyrimidine deaminase/5-amino-6-(5-phosphoribosylamino)uracil reductase
MEIEKYFFRALEKAESAKGLTSPNPAVGCVIVRNGKVLAEGATGKPGESHAERDALQKSHKFSRGAALFVTLEPCVEFHGKKTPSCSSLIIEAGIKKVYAGTADPNPEVNGRGLRMLEKAGIEVIMVKGFEKRLRVLNEDYFKFIKTGMPYVYLKCAMTLDGNIADSRGGSKWISSEESRRYGHGIRNRVDAVIIGVNTVKRDDPELTVRMVGRLKDPLRIILDPFGKTPAGAKVMSGPGKSLFVVRKDIDKNFIELCVLNGKDYLEFEYGERFDLKSLVEYLGRERGIESILIEGGGKLYYDSFRDKIVDKVIIFVAPKILGGRGIPFINGITDTPISGAINLKDFSAENIGEDIMIQGYL